MIGKDELVKWLRIIDKKLRQKLTLIAVGGTAMTLLGLKSSTIDIDFCIASKDKKAFEQVVDNKFNIDIFVDGYIFSEQLPDDYAEKSKEIAQLNKITLKALHPIDIIITKAARFNARDEEDIKTASKYVNKEELVKRFKNVVKTYSGNEEDYQRNFEVIVKRFFS